MSDHKVTVTRDGEEHDITTHLEVLYDCIIGSMDWGSQFLDEDNAAAILELGALCGFDSATYKAGAHGYPLLYDEEGGVLNAADFQQTYKHATADVWVTGEGRELHITSPVDRDSVVVRVDIVKWHRTGTDWRNIKNKCYVAHSLTLPHSVEVWSTEPTKFTVLIPHGQKENPPPEGLT